MLSKNSIGPQPFEKWFYIRCSFRHTQDNFPDLAFARTDLLALQSLVRECLSDIAQWGCLVVRTVHHLVLVRRK